ncbi:MAG: XdhC family protein [Planctomycetes bacterium]|nr:XdhC family protein [Planctomycetota bacterium]
MNPNDDIFEAIVRLRRGGVPAALATIVGTRGSTPGRTTMRLLVLDDGTFLGTVGGGCLEAEVYDTAMQVIADEQPRSLQFRLTEQDSPDSGLMCGGEVTIFVEPITTPCLWIFGGGHISKALCQVAAIAGFRTTVVDDRPDFTAAGRFPEAHDTVCAQFPEAVAQMPIRQNSYAVVVTRGHREDGVVLEALARRYAAGDRLRFLGMIGSRTKRALLWKHLLGVGATEEFLASVRTPMGAYLGGKSHEEIAVSVIAELISVRRLGRDLAAGWDARPRKEGGGVEGVRELSLDPDPTTQGRQS